MRILNIALTFLSIVLFVVLISKYKSQYDVIQKNYTENPNLPHFAAIKNTSIRKINFIDFIYPLINLEIDKIKKQRSDLLKWIAINDQENICSLAQTIGLDCLDENTEKKLLLHIDYLPASLVIAQAGNESAWGTSRFARENLNLFGIWCFTAGCGSIPYLREENAKHEITRYDSVQNSITEYFSLLNTHPAYNSLRQVRFQQREKGEKLNSLKLAEELVNYSSNTDYVESIKKIILTENLRRFDALQEN